MNTDDITRLIDQAATRFITAPAEAIALGEQAIAALTPDTPAPLHARAHWARGLARHHAGQHADGLADLNQALTLVPHGDEALRSQVLRGLSAGCELLGSLDDALAWGTQALEAAHRSGDAVLVADALMSIGVITSRCGDAAAGLQHYREVLALFEAAGGDPRRRIRVLNNMGINCKNLGRHEESLAHYERAIELANEIGDPGMRAVLQSNLGEPLWQLGRLAEARQALDTSIAQLAPGGYTGGETHARVTLGRLLLAMGEPAAAQTELEHALRLSESSDGRNYAARAHQTLAELHKAAGRFEPALHHHEAFRAAERSQFNEESDRKLRALRVQFEVDQARHEAELQRLRHVELANAHAALLAADEEKTRLLERLEAQTRTDALTGLANRRELDERLADEFARAQRHGKPLSVAMCDLDHFKRINDRLGHATGDEVLRRVGRVLRERCRSTDLVARYGGEEFCIAFLESDAALAARACDELRMAIAAQDWHAVHPELQVTLSIGVSDDLSLLNHEQMLADADMHLYRAKHDGKNRVRWRASL